MWTPLPQILERCLFEVYAARGFDITTPGATPGSTQGTTRTGAFHAQRALRHGGAGRSALATYARVTADLRAALLTRLNALRVGGKGLMLDGRRSTALRSPVGGPNVLELEPVW
jgi:hypothetical protein